MSFGVHGQMDKLAAAIANQKQLVEQLRHEYNFTRTPLTQTTKDIIEYIDQHKEQDPLINGVDKKQNPYMEKSSCAIL